MARNLTIRGLSVNAFIRDFDTRRLIDYVTRGLSAGTLKPIIDRAFDMDRIGDAYRYLEGGEQVGKVVVTTCWAER
jgi:NADPH:quinone reductase-like Zn-dependent oxidoreductase